MMAEATTKRYICVLNVAIDAARISLHIFAADKPLLPEYGIDPFREGDRFERAKR